MKLVRETLNQYLQFTEDGDPVNDMGIGTEHLIHEWLRKYNIKKHQYRLSKDKKIIGDSTIVLTELDIEEFPEYINFLYINGGFHCNSNNLISLRGCPRLVQGSFFCSGNALKSSGLIGGPKQVTGSYGASDCGLESLEGIANKIEDSLFIDDNFLHSLEFIPKELKNLHIGGNPIETLEYFPEKISGDLFITSSKILNKHTISKICEISGNLYEY